MSESLTVTTYSAAGEFLNVAEDWLVRHEAANNLMLGLARRCADTAPAVDPVMMTVARGGELAAAMFMTPPRGAILYAPGEVGLAALDQIAEKIPRGRPRSQRVRRARRDVPCVREDMDPRTRQSLSLQMGQFIYEARQVTPPTGVSGLARLATSADLDFAADWMHRFNLEALGESQSDRARAEAESLIAAGRLLLWIDAGRAVSMAATARPTRTGIAIASVYTPPEDRGRGYASACVAEMTRRQLDAGREFVCLYADRANPTSNRIYRGLGYVPVIESAHYRFEPAETS